MDPVRDDGVEAAAGGHEAREARLAVVQGAHGVEGVGQGGGARVESRQAVVVRGGGVAEGDDEVGI